jgi:hypothetical protein
MLYQLFAALFGLWLMAAPAVLGLARPAATSAWIIGPIVATLATVAMWAATRGARWANLPAGLWLVLAPLFLDHSAIAAANSTACGIAIGTLSAIRGKVPHRFGGGWSAIVKHDPGGRAREYRHA